jgi:hypothetical protein
MEEPLTSMIRFTDWLERTQTVPVADRAETNWFARSVFRLLIDIDGNRWAGTQM